MKSVDGRDLANVLTAVIRMINSTNHPAVKSKLFSTLYSDTSAENKTLLLHIEMLKIVLNRALELQEETFLLLGGKDP